MKYTADNLPKCFTMFAMGVQYKLTLTENGKYFCDFDRRYYEVGHGLQDIPTLLQSLNNGDWKVLQNLDQPDRKSTRLNSSHIQKSRMPSSA